MSQQLAKKQLQLLALHRQAEALKPTAQIAALKRRLHQLDKAIGVRMLQLIQEKKRRCAQLVEHVKAIDPKNLLTKGYSILFHENTGSVILSSGEVQPQVRVAILMHDGRLNATVNEVVR